jgi:hypothetical protein
MQRAAHTRDAKAIGQSPSPIETSVSVGDNRKMSLKTGDGKPLTANMTSNNKLQLKFRSIFLLLGRFVPNPQFGTTRPAKLHKQLISRSPPQSWSLYFLLGL